MYEWKKIQTILTVCRHIQMYNSIPYCQHLSIWEAVDFTVEYFDKWNGAALVKIHDPKIHYIQFWVKKVDLKLYVINIFGKIIEDNAGDEKMLYLRQGKFWKVNFIMMSLRGIID